MNKRPELRELFKDGLLSVIKSDLARLCEPNVKNFFKIYLFPKGTVFRFIFWFRILQWCRTSKVKKLTIGLVAYLCMRHYEYRYGIHANANIYIGKGLHIKHGDGVHLNCQYIGENFTCYQGVTLGSKYGGIPSVEDSVTVYTNSVVCGDVVLGKHCIVGAQSYVDKDVEDGMLVAGIPAKVILKKND